MSNLHRLSTLIILIYLLINPNDGLCISTGEKKDAMAIPVKTPNNVEIFVEGKRYKSVEEYKQDKIKNPSEGEAKTMAAQEGPSLNNKEEPKILNEDESKQKNEGTLAADKEDSGNLSDSNSGSDPDLIQMQELLKEFQQKHKEATPITIDPTQVKTIIIPSKSKGLSQEDSYPSNNASMK